MVVPIVVGAVTVGVALYVCYSIKKLEKEVKALQLGAGQYATVSDIEVLLEPIARRSEENSLMLGALYSPPAPVDFFQGTQATEEELAGAMLRELEHLVVGGAAASAGVCFSRADEGPVVRELGEEEEEDLEGEEEDEDEESIFGEES